MKNVGVALFCSVSLGLGLSLISASAFAVAPGGRPPTVFGEVVAAAPAAEQPRWASMLALFGSKGPLPPVDAIVAGLGKMVGATTLDGIDTKRPVAIVVLDPRTYPKPVLVVAEVASDKTLATSLQATPEVTSKRQKRVVVIGAADAIAAGGDYALGRLGKPPQDGLRARVFVEPVWAAFGAQATAMKALMVAQAGSPGSPMPAASMGKIFDGIISGIEQSNELDVDVGARNGGIDFTMSLLVRPDSGIDKFAAQQQPADFSMLAKFADQPQTFIAGGRVNMQGAGEGMLDLFFGGATKDPKLAAQVTDWIRLASGEIGMVGNIPSPQKVEYQYLLRSPEAAKLASVFPAMIDAMNQNGMLEGMAKINRTPKPNASYDGLTLAQSELHYDFTKMATAVGEKKFTLSSVWTSWDDVVAMATGGNASERMKKLIDSARHGKGTWTPGASIRAGIERARAAKESMWMRLDFSTLAASTGKPSALPPGIAPAVGLGAAPHTIWMRISVPAPPQTAGSL